MPGILTGCQECTFLSIGSVLYPLHTPPPPLIAAVRTNDVDMMQLVLPPPQTYVELLHGAGSAPHPWPIKIQTLFAIKLASYILPPAPPAFHFLRCAHVPTMVWYQCDAAVGPGFPSKCGGTSQRRRVGASPLANGNRRFNLPVISHSARCGRRWHRGKCKRLRQEIKIRYGAR